MIIFIIKKNSYEFFLILFIIFKDCCLIFYLFNMMQMKEFLTIPEEDIVYDIPNILEFENMFKNRPVDHPDEMDDSTEIEIISVSNALQSLKTLNLFLLQQENASEQVKLMGKIEKFIKKEQINSMQQTTIDRYFR